MAISTTRGGSSPKALTLPLPSPKAPPGFPDLYGKRREMSRVQMLEREISFLEEELKSSEGLQPASRCIKEIDEFVMAKADPLLPTKKKNRRSRRFWKWLCSMPCFNLSWICCCCWCCDGCSQHLKLPSCSCSFFRPCCCFSCFRPCSSCCTCPKPKCHCCCTGEGKPHCCSKGSCGCKNCCIPPSCNVLCPCLSCCSCKCSCSCTCPTCPKIQPCSCCTKSCWNSCCC